MNDIAWIDIIQPENAGGDLKDIYDQVTTPHGTVDNVMKVHSLRPQTMRGHVVLYRSVLHDDGIVLPLWYLECIASYTSIINECDYSLTHHFNNAKRLLGDNTRADAILAALKRGQPEQVFEGKELHLMRYAGKLTASPGKMIVDDVAQAREAGASDGEILEVNQVCAYFNYSNRLLNGLGVSTKGDNIGYYSAENSQSSKPT